MNGEFDRKFLEQHKSNLRSIRWIGVIGMIVGFVLAAAFYVWLGQRYEEVSHRSRYFKKDVKTMNRKTLEKLALKRDERCLKLIKVLRDGISLLILVGMSGISVAVILSYRTEKKYLEIISRLQETS